MRRFPATGAAPSSGATTMETQRLKVAGVGAATGAVGTVLLEVLDERNFPVGWLGVLGSGGSVVRLGLPGGPFEQRAVDAALRIQLDRTRKGIPCRAGALEPQQRQAELVVEAVFAGRQLHGMGEGAGHPLPIAGGARQAGDLDPGRRGGVQGAKRIWPTHEFDWR